MIADLKPYPAYKDSGVPWLGEVPRHWEVSRLKSRLLRSDAGVWGDQFDSDGTVVLRSTEQTIDGGWRIATPARIRLSQSQRDAGLLAAGDLVVTKSSGSPAHIGKTSLVSPEVVPLNCCFSNFMQRLRVNRATSPYLVWRILNSPVGREQLVFQSTTTTGLGNLNGTILGNCRFAFPPLPEQTAIVRFLDHADRRIRRYIRAKQKLIRLLEEQKQAIIQQAVTRGLDPTVRLKSSGVEWLGDVPEHWEVRKLRQCGVVAGGMTPSMEVRRFWDGAIPWVTPKDMKQAALGDSSVRVSDAAIAETSLRMIAPPAILLVVRGMILARRVPVARTTATVTINQDMKALKPADGINAEFLALSMEAAQEAFVPLIDEAGHGTRRLPTERWREIAVALPTEDEQATIVRYLEQATGRTLATIDRAQREIGLLREYRTRLIADVVTGKLDVREAAARLPDEADEPEALDDADSFTDTEEDGLDDLDAVQETEA